LQETWEPGLLHTFEPIQFEVADMNKLTKTLGATAVACAMAIPFTAAQAWGPWGGGGPWSNGWGNDSSGEGWGSGDMDFSMSGSGHGSGYGRGRGYGYGYGGYPGYGYGGYPGYGGYGGPGYGGGYPGAYGAPYGYAPPVAAPAPAQPATSAK
jgi:hypothetical protein